MLQIIYLFVLSIFLDIALPVGLFSHSTINIKMIMIFEEGNVDEHCFVKPKYKK